MKAKFGKSNIQLRNRRKSCATPNLAYNQDRLIKVNAKKTFTRGSFRFKKYSDVTPVTGDNADLSKIIYLNKPCLDNSLETSKM